MTGWLHAAQQSGQIQAAYPEWTVRPVRRRDGTGVEAFREADGLCSVTGPADEVRAALAEADRQQPTGRQ